MLDLQQETVEEESTDGKIESQAHSRPIVDPSPPTCHPCPLSHYLFLTTTTGFS